MGNIFFDKLLERKKRKYVFLGGSGSGKSELAIHYALSFAGLKIKNIHFFDMDQSKPLCRSRDVKKIMKDSGICFHSGEQFLGSPIVPRGVESIINDKKNLVILDVGGNVTGAINIGQYAEFFNDPDAVAYVVINYFRPFSKKEAYIEETIHSIKRSSGIRDMEIISNPFPGMPAKKEDIKFGHHKVSEMLGNMGRSVQLLAVPEYLWNGCSFGFGKHILKIRPYIRLV